ncbi:MAG: hypothetical protein HRF43_09815 [Phycisphaerae bacterium]|jgi:hypothetical protein
MQALGDVLKRRLPGSRAWANRREIDQPDGLELAEGGQDRAALLPVLVAHLGLALQVKFSVGLHPMVLVNRRVHTRQLVAPHRGVLSGQPRRVGNGLVGRDRATVVQLKEAVQ